VRQTFRPGLDRLEERALLSGVSASGLADSLTAVAGRTTSGTRVVETFIETNVSNHDITVGHGPSNAGFSVIQGGKVVYNPTAGFIPQFLAIDVLKPGQSLTLNGTWDGRSNVVDPTDPGKEGPPLSGTFTISNGLDPSTTAVVTIPKSWTVPVKGTHVVPPRPPAQLRVSAPLLTLSTHG
jgi:hypothetical protein